MPDFGTTPIFGLTYPEATASDNVPRDVKKLAQDTERALGAATGGGTVTFTRVGGVVTLMVETRPDGSQRLAVPRYANDRLVAVTRYNPSAVDTLTYNGAGYFTGYTTA